MSGPTSLEFTAPSKETLRTWGLKKEKEVEEVERLFLHRIEAWFSRETTRSFDKQAQPGGAAWPENSDSWMDFKLSDGRSPLTNIYTSAMRMSIATDRDAHSARVGSPLEYSKYAQDRKDSALNRPFLPEEEYAEEYAVGLIKELIRQKVS